VLEAVTQRSPLLLQVGAASAFDPPRDFTAYAARPRRVDLVHPRSVKLGPLAAQLGRHWPADEVRVRQKPLGTSLLVEPLGGSINFSQDGGDDRTFCCIHYDQSCTSLVEELVAELVTVGFTEIGRM